MQVEGQVDQKIDHMAPSCQVGCNSQNAKKYIYFSMCFSPSASQLRSKIDKKASPDRSKSSKKLVSILMQLLMNPTSPLGGGVLGSHTFHNPLHPPEGRGLPLPVDLDRAGRDQLECLIFKVNRSRCRVLVSSFSNTILERFGSILEPFWLPRWDQIHPNSV